MPCVMSSMLEIDCSFCSCDRSAFLSVLKMLKLLLVSSAYACIMEVVRKMKAEPGSISEQRRASATHLQSALEQIIPPSEQRLKNTAMQLAKQYYEKVSVVVVSTQH